MNKKVIILSWCNADNVLNYGQVLQALAMMKLVRRYTGEDITYVSYHPRTKKNKVRCFIDRYNLFTGHLFPYINTKKLVRIVAEQNKICFRQVSEYKSLSKLSENARLLLCGSDQIWHPRNYDPGYYLNFGSENIVRASYASSLPKTHIESQFETKYDNIKKCLRKFNYISVRESSSKDFIEKLSGKKVDIVLDPTFLIDKQEWESLIEETGIKEDFIFVYIPNGMDSYIEKQIDAIRNNTGIDKVIILMTRGTNQFYKYKTIKYVTIGQFLYLIKNSSFVITTSFHAVVFSLIFEKEFLCHDVTNHEQGEDTRLSDLLGLFNLQEKLNSSFNSQVQNINYTKIKKIMDEEIEHSKTILKSIIM